MNVRSQANLELTDDRSISRDNSNARGDGFRTCSNARGSRYGGRTGVRVSWKGPGENDSRVISNCSNAAVCTDGMDGGRGPSKNCQIRDGRAGRRDESMRTTRVNYDDGDACDHDDDGTNNGVGTRRRTGEGGGAGDVNGAGEILFRDDEDYENMEEDDVEDGKDYIDSRERSPSRHEGPKRHEGINVRTRGHGDEQGRSRRRCWKKERMDGYEYRRQRRYEYRSHVPSC